MKTYKVIYCRFPDAEDIEVEISACTEEEAVIFAKEHRKDPFRIVEVKKMKRKEYVYIAVKLNRNSVPKIVGVFRKEDDANKAAYSGDGWGNVIKRELK